MIKNPMVKKCSKKFNQKQKDNIKETMTGIIGFRCFMANFNNACKEYVHTTYVQPFLMVVIDPVLVGIEPAVVVGIEPAVVVGIEPVVVVGIEPAVVVQASVVVVEAPP